MLLDILLLADGLIWAFLAYLFLVDIIYITIKNKPDGIPREQRVTPEGFSLASDEARRVIDFPTGGVFKTFLEYTTMRPVHTGLFLGSLVILIGLVVVKMFV